MSIELALALDVFTVIGVAAVAQRVTDLRLSHPMAVAWVLHVLVVTVRLAALALGAPYLFETWGGFFIPATEGELVFAAALADLQLCACVVATLVSQKRRAGAPNKQARGALFQIPAWSFGIGVTMAIAGAGFGLRKYGVVPGRAATMDDLNVVDASGLSSSLMTWLGVLTVLVVFRYGAGGWPGILLILNTLLMAFQGYHRFRVVLPLFLALLIFLDERRRRWPRFPLVLACVAGMAMFIPLKMIGKSLQEGASLSEIEFVVSRSIRETAIGESPETFLLDQMAVAVSAVRERGTLLWGRSYLSMATLPIPRGLWPAKPGLGDHIKNLGTPGRPLGEMGAVVFLTGESYINFGLVGVVLVPGIVMALLVQLHRHARNASSKAPERLLYYVLIASWLQVWRDGLPAFLTFGVVGFMPALTVVALAMWARRRPSATVAVRRIRGTVRHAVARQVKAG